jgi:hypothetical protein
MAAQQMSPLNAVPSRIVATYDFKNSQRDLALPSSVTVVDSAGTIVAKAAIAGERREVPMTVTILDSDLVLQGQTTGGVLTLVLGRQNEGDSTRVSSGRWILGNVEGTLRGRVKR